MPDTTQAPSGEKTLSLVKDLTETWLDGLGRITADDAGKILEAIGKLDAALVNAATNLRVALGTVLLEIQSRSLYEGMGHQTWSSFLSTESLSRWGIRLRTAYDAMTLAKSPTLTNLPPDARGKIPLTNARTLAQLEKADPEKAAAPETIEQAQTLPGAEFKREVGASRGYKVSAWVKDKEAGKEIQRLVDFFARASADAAGAFADLLESAEVGKRTADGVDDAVDLILGVILNSVRTEFVTDEWQQEEQEALRYAGVEEAYQKAMEGGE